MILRRAPRRLQRGLFVVNPFLNFGGGGGGGDPNFASVALLLHFPASGTTITDSSGTPATVTANNGAAGSTTQIKYGVGSLFLDGTNDVVTTNRDNSGTIGTGQFTLEAWIRPDTAQTGRIISAQTAGAVNPVIAIRVDSTGALTFILRNSAGAGTLVLSSATGLVAMNDSAWYHVAVTRDGSNAVNIWLDGTSVASSTSATSPSGAGVWHIGNQFGTAGGAAEYFAGYIDDVRITTGVCRYTGTFTPPAAQFPDS
jgi:hypothetical protein